MLFVGICLLKPGTVVEIESAMVVYGEAQRRGRFLLRRSQHEHLLEEGGVYLFAVCAPTPARDMIHSLNTTQFDSLRKPHPRRRFRETL
ncbi:hypothetical protein E6P09_14090 [Haloferax mediterranei ATCC 33500]|uniref:Uncharacterized protein n=1 Tax=Haloferax mediterranei (strain ATCC 33500 / DSM 1411 / JCM 8866 / NBRC 14739 / NCIMB 2177 / R-4) TaxID=523841 RepID=I3R7K6_HALMT|nr:hypothetical protein HFX_2534 [Haloferax mediterranei ATCC 33500]AHZ23590.1 hypothetical protein BM92_13495 [Haloferax mediterranei ATCC 33500]ELZ99074.1 hypothetical protein C439_14484 [Haloferax mediterranei ATCC 33500]QCQ76346.1 hypothetical protein E6P09_14090 [Haloferax mediterranei ATCC 33500]